MATARLLVHTLIPGLALVALTAGCSSSPSGSASSEANADVTTGASSGAASQVSLGGVGPLASDTVHDVSVTFDTADYDAMLANYQSTQEKDWISATVTIDDATFHEVGLRLKGNSSLRTVATDADPATLPWLIDLNQFVDDQSYDGLTELVVRSNSTSTSLNEAVALELIEQAGLASQDAVATRFTVNGSDAVLRLVIDNPDNDWMAEQLSASGALYKADANGDYSYRGTDPTAYDDIFDQEAGKKNADLTPLIEFLDFVNNSDDATFAAELGDHLDIDAFATYLAIEDLIDNFDDISGPGNNSYLFYDTESTKFTVVAWDHNLAFGASPGGPGMGGGMGGGGRPGGGPPPFDSLPTDFTFPDGSLPQFPGGGPGGGPSGMNRANPLVDRFLAVDEWQALVDQKTDELRAALLTSGVATAILDQWKAIVTASGLVDAATVTSESDSIAALLK